MSLQDYPMSPEEHDRLDRLASEVRGGGGLALPDFFGALLEELLDNGPTDNARLVRIVATTLDDVSCSGQEAGKK